MTSRNWCFTLNNPVPEDKDIFLTASCKFVKFQLEQGDSGTPHFQGLIMFTNVVRLKTLRKIHPQAHYESMKSIKGSLAYVEKTEGRLDGPFQAGIQPKVQGQRTDLEQVTTMIKEGSSMRAIAEEHPVQFIKFHRGFEALRSHLETPREWMTELYIYTGPTRTGKSKLAHDLTTDPYVKSDGDWWDGYDRHDDVIIDDFACDMKITQLLRLCDRYPMRVPVKGGFRQFVAKRVFITSNLPFKHWYASANPEHRLALEARVTDHREF